MSLELVEWALTRACNLSCLHCHARRGNSRDPELTPDEALDLVDRLASADCRSITLSGGEPLLRRDWVDIAGRLAGRGTFTQVVSNGSLLDRAAAERARDAGVGTFLLSLDGVGRAHDRVRRRPGSFREVMNACDALDTAGVRLGFITTLLATNQDQLEPLSELVSERRATIWQVWIGMPPGGQARRRLWLCRDDAARLRRRIAELQPSCPPLVPGDNLREEHACAAGTRVLGIGSDGRVRGCLALPVDYSVGSIRDRTLGELQREVERRSPPCPGCRATALEAGSTHPATAIGKAAAAALLASGLAWGCSSTGNPSGTALTESAAPAKSEAEAKPSGIGAIPSPSQMPPCCLSHMLIPGCVCSWKSARSAALKIALQIPSTGEMKDVPGGVEIECRTGQTGLTPGRLKIVEHTGPAPLARPADVTLMNGAVLHATGEQPADRPGEQKELTRTGILTLGEESFEVTCWTEFGTVVGVPPLWPDWCSHSLGTIEKSD